MSSFFCFVCMLRDYSDIGEPICDRFRLFVFGFLNVPFKFDENILRVKVSY